MKTVDDRNQVPADAVEALARCLYPAIRSYFESEEGKAAFEKWKAATVCQVRQDTNALWVPTAKKQAS